LTSNYNVDSAKLTPFIRKFLKVAELKGALVQINDTGAASHFKLITEAKKPVMNNVVVAAKRSLW